jgi:hypothetical protein
MPKPENNQDTHIIGELPFVIPVENPLARLYDSK